MNEVIDNDTLFMSMVFLVAMKSRDTNTHIGSVIVDSDNEVRSIGFNDFAKSIHDKPERQEKPEKFFWFDHAERKSIYSAARFGSPLKGCKMYTNGVPCADCGIGIIQSGISEVIVDYDWNKNNSGKWKDSTKRALKMFEEAGVDVRYWKGDIVQIQKFRRGELQ